MTVLSCPFKCRSGWEANQIKFQLNQPLPFHTPSRSVVVSVRFSTMSFVRVCCIRVCFYSSSVAQIGECCQSYVDRPRTLRACEHSPSVKLLRRFQFCKSGPISLRSFDRYTSAKRGKCTADIFTQGSNRPQRPFRPPQPAELQACADLTFCNTADSASASRGVTAVLVREHVVSTAHIAAS